MVVNLRTCRLFFGNLFVHSLITSSFQFENFDLRYIGVTFRIALDLLCNIFFESSVKIETHCCRLLFRSFFLVSISSVFVLITSFSWSALLNIVVVSNMSKALIDIREVSLTNF